VRLPITVAIAILAAPALAGCGTLLPCISIDGAPNRVLYWTQPELNELASKAAHAYCSPYDGVCDGDLEGVNGFWIIWRNGDGPNGWNVKAQVWSDDSRFPPKDSLKPAVERTFAKYGWPEPTYLDAHSETGCD
jgi:hypothetical protein